MKLQFFYRISYSINFAEKNGKMFVKWKGNSLPVFALNLP